jgi:hypothetical protein
MFFLFELVSVLVHYWNRRNCTSPACSSFIRFNILCISLYCISYNGWGAVVALIVWELDLQLPCNQCLSPLMLWVWISIRARCTTLCDKVGQWLKTGRWFSTGTPVSSTNKTGRHNKTEILLKVALSTIKQTNTQTFLIMVECLFRSVKLTKVSYSHQIWPQLYLKIYCAVIWLVQHR